MLLRKSQTCSVEKLFSKDNACYRSAKGELALFSFPHNKYKGNKLFEREMGKIHEEPYLYGILRKTGHGMECSCPCSSELCKIVDDVRRDSCFVTV